MRFLISAVILSLALLASPASFAAMPGLDGAGVDSAIVQVDARCGPHRHYVRHHHHYQGHWVGRCVAG